MNHLTNDYGKLVISAGAPGSVVRVRVQYPRLIDRISFLHMHGFCFHAYVDDEIIQAMIDSGVDSKLEAKSIVQAVLSKLDPEFPGSKMELIPHMFLEKLIKEKSCVTHARP